MPRFAANLAWLFTERPFLERFAAARAAGFEAVEFPQPYAHPAAEIAGALRDNGLRCVLFNLPMGDRDKGDFGIACRPGREAEFRDSVARGLEYAEALRPERVNVIAGTIRPGEDAADLERRLVDHLRYAAAEFARAGRELVMEPINDRDTPGFFVPRQREAARLIARAGAANLGLQCDLYHAAMMGDDPAGTLAALHGIIRHVQFADVPGRGEPGSGTLPWTQLFATLDRLGYAGWCSAEYRPTKRTEDTLGWLRPDA